MSYTNPNAQQLSQAQLQQIAYQAAQQYGVPPQIAMAVIQHESGWQNVQSTINADPSTDGIGYMQLIPSTAATSP